ncbi:MAG: hypothetical protein DKINENOH_04362 [bacterium]|nr:hypothetical protein [bacterium]
MINAQNNAVLASFTEAEDSIGSLSARVPGLRGKQALRLRATLHTNSPFNAPILESWKLQYVSTPLVKSSIWFTDAQFNSTNLYKFAANSKNSVHILLIDPSLVSALGTRDTLGVKVKSSLTGDSMRVVLKVASEHLTEFRGGLPISFNTPKSGNDTLEVQDRDVLQVNYVDPFDAFDTNRYSATVIRRSFGRIRIENVDGIKIDSVGINGLFFVRVLGETDQNLSVSVVDSIPAGVFVDRIGGEEESFMLYEITANAGEFHIRQPIRVSSQPTDSNDFRLRAAGGDIIVAQYTDEGSESYDTANVMDTDPPRITHTSIDTARLGQDVIVSVQLSDSIGIISEPTLVFYRLGGRDSSFYRSAALINLVDDSYQAVIPGDSVTERGVEYYIKATDNSGNSTTDPSENPANEPHTIQIYSDNFFAPAPTPRMAYRMISIPFDLTNKAAESVLVDDLGHYDDRHWRFLRYIKDTIYAEFGDSMLVRFEPGRGFWLITREPKNLDSGAGYSVTTAKSFELNLQPGWNQIGNPFAFPVSWNDKDVVIKGDTVATALVGYQGSSNELIGYDYTRTVLNPWEGYFVNNPKDEVVMIRIRPIDMRNRRPSISKIGTGNYFVRGNEWVIQVIAKSKRHLDKDNYLGGFIDASDTWDFHDFPEAPFFAEQVSLYFPHHDWKIFPDEYSGDFRTLSSNGHVWNFHVKANIEESTVTLEIKNPKNLPPNWIVKLLDSQNLISMNLIEGQVYSFAFNPDEPERKFQLAAGRRDFVDSTSMGYSNAPDKFVLSQNYPNPFNPQTRINYELPVSSLIDLVVLDLTGRLVSSLVYDYQSPGRYQIWWDGKSSTGKYLSSGIYFLRMKAGSFVAVKKMILVR